MKETRAEKNYVSEVAFRRWVEAMYEQFHKNNEAILYNGRRGYTYVYLRSKVGVARCNPTDKWNTDIGIAYAWARCTGQPEYYEKKTYIPKMGEWVYVSAVNSKFRPLLQYMCEGIDYYCFKLGRGELTLVKKTDVTNITPAD